MPENTESEPGSDSDSVQMLGKELQLEAAGKEAASTSSAGKSRRSSMWSKKLPQSISSMKFGPIIFSENFPEKIRKEKKKKTVNYFCSMISIYLLVMCQS